MSGSSTARQSYIVGTMSVAWQYWCRSSPRASMPFGQDTISASAVPPSQLNRFHIFIGVLNAAAQPVG